MLQKMSVLALLLLCGACSHPIEVQGEGDVKSASGDRDCSAQSSPCKVVVAKDYIETYTAVPAAGYRFSHWIGCGKEITNQCIYNVDAATVAKFWGKTTAPLIAVFENVGTSPTAMFTANGDFEKHPLQVDFDGSISVDADNNIVSYNWDFGDNTQSQGARVSHSYLATGTYIASLSVRDSEDNSHTVSHRVRVAKGQDPLYSFQWHLLNNGQAGNGSAGTVGADINVEPVWKNCGVLSTCRGEGILVAVVDNGLQITHPDLQANIVNGSHNYVDGSTDPTPRQQFHADYHGTAVGGLIAATGDNDIGVVGVAPGASLVGYNVISSEYQATDADEANAATRGDEDISNNSWGYTDNTGALLPAPQVWRDAIDHGLAKGRGGKGKIYVFAAGNGFPEDLSTMDGKASYRGVIAVGALTDEGKIASYSEPGTNLIVTAPGGEFCDTNTITSTDLTGDRGANPPAPDDDGPDLVDTNYTKCFNGTSAATPLVSGVIALVLQANNQLGWRDVKALLATTARKTDPTRADWETNGAGHPISHQYGFGAVDAAAAVAAAPNWAIFPAEKQSQHTVTINTAIPDFDPDGLSVTVDAVSTVNYVEAIEVTIDATHTYVSDLGVDLINLQTGTTSHLVANLSDTRPARAANMHFTFYSALHLGENANGRWQIKVFDQQSGDVGTWNDLKLSFYGH